VHQDVLGCRRKAASKQHYRKVIVSELFCSHTGRALQHLRNVGESDWQEAKRFQDKNRLHHCHIQFRKSSVHDILLDKKKTHLNIQRATGVSQHMPLIRDSSPMSIDTQSLDNEIIGPIDIQVPDTADR
jgi:hypothetical protein